MGVQAYRSVLAIRAVRRVLLLATIVRIPLWASNVVLTLHVLNHLHRSYSAAGALAGVATVCLMISSPWRGRRLDRLGLRRSIVPSLVIMLVCWSVAPFLPYWPLLAVVALGELFMVPMFSIVRQALIAVVPDDLRKSALALDSVFIEITFMIGPAAGVVLATVWPTQWALLTCGLALVGGGLLVWIVNPALRRADATGETATDDTATDETAADETAAGEQHKIGVRTWISPAVLGVFGVCFAATLVLSGTDVGIVAALRHMHDQSAIGWVLAVWGLGSAVGGALYGLLRRPISAYLLLALLAITTIPAVLARTPLQLAGLLLVAGLFCAPTITAVNDELSRIVPERVLGEVLGWQGSAMTAGSALGAPVAGVAIDRAGWGAAFLITGVLSLAAAAVGLLTVRARRARGAAAADIGVVAVPLAGDAGPGLPDEQTQIPVDSTR